MGKLAARVEVMMGRQAELELLDLKTCMKRRSYFCLYPLFIWINSCIDILTELLSDTFFISKSH